MAQNLNGKAVGHSMKLKTMIDLCKTCSLYPCGDIEANEHCSGLNHEPKDIEIDEA